MHKLIKFYYDNKFKIWRIIIIIVSVLLIIQLLNYLQKNKNEKNLAEMNNTIANAENNRTDTEEENKTTVSNTSLATGEEISEETAKSDETLIRTFINYCNNGEIEKAYEIISNECKKQLYPNIDNFKNNYINYIFNGNQNKTATIENWSSGTYKINLKDDVMATGKVSMQATQDYMTIVSEDNIRKLNINSFVGTQEINKSNTDNNIEIEVIEKNVYIDYEQYRLKVKNNSGNTVLLDSLKSTKTIYVQDGNNVKYYSYSHEIPESLLKVDNESNGQLTIKFIKSYSPSRPSKSITFSNIILDYNNYLKGNFDGESLTIDM